MSVKTRIDFSESMLLREMYEWHDLFEDCYDYKCKIFDKIKKQFEIRKVKRIYNPQLYGMYLLRKEELLLENENISKQTVVKEKFLYHATSVSNAKSIAKNNIDWRMTRRSRFGIGACFSPCPHHANKYSSSKGAFVIFQVLMKNVEEVGISYELAVPAKLENDTTWNGEDVYGKYDDCTFYPKYIVYLE